MTTIDALPRQYYDLTSSALTMRFVAAEEQWLSPAYHRDSCAIDFFLVGQVDWSISENLEMHRKLALTLTSAVVSFPSARPHWGKRHAFSDEMLLTRYPKFGEFLNYRDNLDPTHLFHFG